MKESKPIARPVRARAIVLLSIAAVAALYFWVTHRDRLDGALSDAVLQDEPERVRALLDQGANARGVLRSTSGAGPLDRLVRLFGADAQRRTLSPLVHSRLRSHRTKPTSLLMAAVEAHDATVASMLVDRGADMNYTLDDGKTALFLCVSRRNRDCLKVLLDRGADVHVRNNLGQTPLHLAARNDQDTVIGTLLDSGAEINAKDSLGRTPLTTAAHYHSGSAVCALLDRGANASDLLQPGLEPPLEWAAATGSIALVRRLLQGRLLPEQSRGAPAALVRAVHAHNVEIVRFLLDCGVPANPPPTPLHALDPAVTPTGVPFSNMQEPPILFSAAATGDPKLFDLLLAHGARIERSPYTGATVLNAAVTAATQRYTVAGISARAVRDTQVASGRVGWWRRTIAGLIDRGANVREADANGRTPLMSAVQDVAIVEMLLKRGADVNAADSTGRTALMAACESGGEAVDRLLAAGARPNDRDKTGATPLMYAVRQIGQAETTRIVRLLLAHGAEMEARDSQGRSAAMLAGASQAAMSSAGSNMADPIVAEVLSLLSVDKTQSAR